MHSYPELTDSYAENQKGLMNLLGLTRPSQAPFNKVLCFKEYDREKPRDWDPNPCHVLTPQNKEVDSEWLCFAFSVVALHHWGEWPESVPSAYFPARYDWRCEIDDEDLGFLSKFFAETWETLRERHPSVRDFVNRRYLCLENHFDMKTEDGLARLTTWLRWIVNALWGNQGESYSSETDADVRALQLVVDLLGKGRLQIVEEHCLVRWVGTWILRAIHLIRNTGILPGQTHAVMTSYSPGNRLMGPAGRSTTSGHSSLGFTPFAPKFDEWGAERFQAQGLQVGFHTYVHPGAYIGRDITIGHSVVIEAGASISDGVIIGDQAYIGVGVYVEPGAHIGIGVKLLDAKPGESPVVIGNRVCLEPGVIIFPDTPMIPSGATLQAGVILRPSSIFQYPEGTVLGRPSPHSSIGPGKHPNTLIVQG